MNKFRRDNNKTAIIPLRRSELITPFGVGAISTNPDGINMVTGALDAWFDTDHTDMETLIREPRLEKILDVKEFRLPPDNKNRTISMVRFPSWHYCSHCGVMEQMTLVRRNSNIKCESCNNNFSRMIQVPIVLVCENGHIDDFPWFDWVHDQGKHKCSGKLKLSSTGGATLSSMKVSCDSCPKNKTLNNLIGLREIKREDSKFRCRGTMPWKGYDDKQIEECSLVPYVFLKNASNVYFPKVINALYLPGDRKGELQDLINILEKEAIQNSLNIFRDEEISKTSNFLIKLHESMLKDFSANQITEALTLMKNEETLVETTDNISENINLKLKREEYEVLVEELHDSEHLKVINEYDKTKGDKSLDEFGLKKINLIPILRDTRVLYSFSRVKNSMGFNADDVKRGKELLFNKPNSESWLPAYNVYGEGIFLEFDEDLLMSWEEESLTKKRFSSLDNRINNAIHDKQIEEKEITPTYVLLHTIAHLLIQEFVFECGYSTAALRERIYVGNGMNGILIYTASGDSEGTLGGLVRLGKIERIKGLLNKAIRNAEWCSSDPICNEIGIQNGQGVNLLNAAACHNCSYLPETSCEEFNRFLDRGLIYSYEEETQGFFQWLEKRK